MPSPRQKAKPQLAALKRLKPEVALEFDPFIKQLMSRIHVSTPNKNWIERIRAVYKEKMTKAFQQEMCPDQFPKEIEGFLKTETYSGPAPKPNRAITPFPERIQAHMYQFVQSLQDALHEERWFAFGTSPKVLASKYHRHNLAQKSIIQRIFNKRDIDCGMDPVTNPKRVTKNLSDSIKERCDRT